MEIRRWHCFVFINFALILPFVAAKSFSINEALAAESKLKKSRDTPAHSQVSAETNTRFSLNKALTSDPTRKSRKYKRGSILSDKSPLIKSRNIFQIGSSRLKELLSSLHKRRTPSKKREIYKDDKIDEKYFPLFKNLGLLFDNLLESESRDSYEVSKHKHKRYKFKGDGKRGVVCSCAVKSDSDAGETRSHKKAVISAEAFATEGPTATAAAAADTAAADISGLGPDKNIPLLLPRDPFGGRGDDHGHSERSGPTLHRNAQRNLAGDIRNRKHPPRNRKYKADAENDEENPDSHTRDDASGSESRERSRGAPDVSNVRTASNEKKPQKSKKAHIFGGAFELPRKVQLKDRRNETESEEFLPKYIRGIRGFVSENKIDDITESIQSEEDYKENFDDVAISSADDKRIASGSGEPSTEAQEIGPGHETMTFKNDLGDIIDNLKTERKSNVKMPSVTIIDGYSVARDKNGQNKLSEKSIRIHG
ncbi:uncharacterized protein LOC135073930 [Ostrinia nubilalis]|uniref:uncharacterized protein LOC135073930 n=1 Tax=Ostrinia nubilalis TaxID=29057 RepID=UPI00308221C0